MILQIVVFITPYVFLPKDLADLGQRGGCFVEICQCCCGNFTIR